MKSRLNLLAAVIVIAALSITVLLQYRQNSELKRELSKIDSAGKSNPDSPGKINQSHLNTLKPASLKNRVSDADVNMSDEERIKKLESQIADMQAWQDYLEESLKKQKQEEAWQSDSTKRMIKSIISSRVDGFADEAGLSADMKTKLFNMLLDKEMEIHDLFSGDFSRDDRKQEMEYITDKYDEMISDLLVGSYPAYTEYVKMQAERSYVEDYIDSMLTRDSQLDRQQEKRLIAAIYNENQSFYEMQKENKDDDNISYVERMKDDIEKQKILLGRYIDSAKDILSESQLQKFQKYLDIEMLKREIDLNTTISLSGNNDINDTDH